MPEVKDRAFNNNYLTNLMQNSAIAALARQPVMVLIHLLNVTIALRLLSLRWKSPSNEVGFLADPLFLLLLLACVLMHIARWHRLSRIAHVKTYTSKIELRQDMERVARRMFGCVPYFISPIPNDYLLETKASEVLGAASAGFSTQSQIDIVFLVLDVRNLKRVHFIAVVIFSFGLWIGGVPHSMRFLHGVWFMVPILMWFVSGLLIYSLTVLGFIMVFHGLRR